MPCVRVQELPRSCCPGPLGNPGPGFLVKVGNLPVAQWKKERSFGNLEPWEPLAPEVVWEEAFLNGLFDQDLVLSSGLTNVKPSCFDLWELFVVC